MKQQFFQGMPYVDLALFSLFLFLAMFVGVLVYVLLVRRRSDFDAVARLPLADGPTPSPASPGAARAGAPPRHTP